VKNMADNAAFQLLSSKFSFQAALSAACQTATGAA